MKTVSGIKLCLLAATSMALLGLAGCDDPRSGQSVGQKVDEAVDKRDRKVDQVADRAQEQGDKAAEVMDDTKITAAVKAGIFGEPGLKVLKIDVDTRDGFVTLSGSADSAQDVQKATQIASGVQGVKSVDNRLQVEG